MISPILKRIHFPFVTAFNPSISSNTLTVSYISCPDPTPTMAWMKWALLVVLAAMAADCQDEEAVADLEETPDHLPNPPPSALDDCDPEMIGFELITGYVFSAPGNVLDSVPGTLMLTDCLETCQGNDSCQSVNYETGLCVLFSSNADAQPGRCQVITYIRFKLQDNHIVLFTKHRHRNAASIRCCTSGVEIATKRLISNWLVSQQSVNKPAAMTPKHTENSCQ